MKRILVAVSVLAIASLACGVGSILGQLTGKPPVVSQPGEVSPTDMPSYGSGSMATSAPAASGATAIPAYPGATDYLGNAILEQMLKAQSGSDVQDMKMLWTKDSTDKVKTFYSDTLGGMGYTSDLDWMETPGTGMALRSWSSGNHSAVVMIYGNVGSGPLGAMTDQGVPKDATLIVTFLGNK